MAPRKKPPQGRQNHPPDPSRPLAVGPPLKPGSIILAFDPGLTTGFCAIRYTARKGQYDFDVLLCQEIPWGERIEAVSRIFDLFAPMDQPSHDIDRLVIEDFVLYAHKARDMVGHRFWSSEMIGVISTLAFQHKVLDRMVLQMASNRKGAKVLEEHTKFVGASPHKTDAYQHARYTLLVEVNSERTGNPRRRKS